MTRAAARGDGAGKNLQRHVASSRLTSSEAQYKLVCVQAGAPVSMARRCCGTARRRDTHSRILFTHTITHTQRDCYLADAPYVQNRPLAATASWSDKYCNFQRGPARRPGHRRTGLLHPLRNEGVILALSVEAGRNITDGPARLTRRAVGTCRHILRPTSMPDRGGGCTSHATATRHHNRSLPPTRSPRQRVRALRGHAARPNGPPNPRRNSSRILHAAAAMWARGAAHGHSVAR